MNHLFWNCRRLGNPRTVRILGDLIKAQKPDLLFLSETLVLKDTIKTLCSKFGFDKHFAVDCISRGGGLDVLWRNNIVCRVEDNSQNHIDIVMLKGGNPDWRLTCYYGFPERGRRREAWDFIRHLSTTSHLPWCIAGDFNDLLSPADKKGNVDHPTYLMKGFKKAIEDTWLVEADLEGGILTWEKSKGKPNWVRERLDRMFASRSWWHLFPLGKLTVHHTICSDHEPIKLELCNAAITKKQFKFKFKNIWLREPEFHKEISDYWQSLPRIHLLPKLLSVTSFMAKWGRNFFHKFRDKVSKQREVVNILCGRSDEDGIKSYFNERDKLNELLLNEEMYWKQRGKVYWLAEGDQNSKFFHAYASARKKSNEIRQLRTDEGDLVTNKERMSLIIVDYFRSIISAEQQERNVIENIDGLCVTEEQNTTLVANITFEEFTVAIKQMHPDKASGPNGLNPTFF